MAPQPPIDDAQSAVTRREALAALAAGLCLLQTGCGYTLGNGFDPQFRTVAVPIFKNHTYRRGIEYQVTEAVMNEIKVHTTYKLAKDGEADTRLVGEIVNIRKDVLGETAYDDPRELQLTIMVKVRWEDARNDQVLAQEESPLTPDAMPLVGQAEFAPETGQSLATATQDSVNRLARKIVNMMETPW